MTFTAGSLSKGDLFWLPGDKSRYEKPPFIAASYKEEFRRHARYWSETTDIFSPAHHSARSERWFLMFIADNRAPVTQRK